jgi:hypothetical protein
MFTKGKEVKKSAGENNFIYKKNKTHFHFSTTTKLFLCSNSRTVSFFS